MGKLHAIILILFTSPKSALFTYGGNKLNLGSGAPRDGQGQQQEGAGRGKEKRAFAEQIGKQNLKQADCSAKPENTGQ